MSINETIIRNLRHYRRFSSRILFLANAKLKMKRQFLALVALAILSMPIYWHLKNGKTYSALANKNGAELFEFTVEPILSAAEPSMAVVLRNRSSRSLTINLGEGKFPGVFNLVSSDGNLAKAMEKSVFDQLVSVTPDLSKRKLHPNQAIEWNVPISHLQLYDMHFAASGRFTRVQVQLPKLAILPYWGRFSEGDYALNSDFVLLPEGFVKLIHQRISPNPSDRLSSPGH